MLNHGGDEIEVPQAGPFSFSTKLKTGSTYDVTVHSQPPQQICTAARGSGTITDADVTDIEVSCVNLVYAVGGSVTGLRGTLRLQNNGRDDLVATTDGAFVFSAKLPGGSRYRVTVAAQPEGQICLVSNSEGTVNADVLDVGVVCTTHRYALRGTVTGLNGALVLQNKGADDLFVNADGAFRFASMLEHGGDYAVTVSTQPAGQTCAVANGSGIAKAEVTDILVTCVTHTYTVGGTITGLVGGTLLLRNNGGNDLTRTADGAFTFDGAIAHGSTYAVTVVQPAGQTCTVINSEGTATADVTDVVVTCTANTYAVGGTLSGLAGTVKLRNNGTDELVLDADGTFTFATRVTHGTSYNVTVSTQPVGQTCAVMNGSGTAEAEVANVRVTCTTNTYAIGGVLSGVVTGTVVLRNNGTDDLHLTADGPFTFGIRVAHDDRYEVTVHAAPAGFVCMVARGAGIATGTVADVAVTCSERTYRVGGTIAGLSGTVVVQNNGADDLPLSAEGPFNFATELKMGERYEVAVLTQPSHQTCTVAYGRGTVSGEVSSIVISCATSTHVVGGTVAGLRGTVVLLNTGGDDLQVTSDGTFQFATEVAAGAPYEVTVLTQPAGQTCAVTNGEGTVAADITDVSVACTTRVYTVSGVVSGLEGSLVLQNNEGDDLTIDADGDFTFSTPVAYGDTYRVTVAIPPAGQTCTVTNGEGTMTTDVTDVTVACTTHTYSIGGTISGLSGTVVLQNNGGDALPLASAGDFAFATRLAHGSTYDVTVFAQPAGQACIVTNGTGTAVADVTDITITCTTRTYSIGGTVAGLSGTLVLQNNGGDDLTLSANGPFAFATPLPHGATYHVSISTQPDHATCAVANERGTAVADVRDISVVCTPHTYEIGGTIAGLTGSVMLRNNSGDDLVRSGDGVFVFLTRVPHGSTYDVTVFTQPTGQTCTVTNGSGTATANVSDVAVVCTTNTYTIGGTISGLAGTVVLHNNGGDPLTRTTNGAFTFAARIVHNGSYNVTVGQQPAGQTCTVTNGSGTATANVSNVAVVCTTKTYTIGGTISGLTGTVVLRNNGSDPLTRTTNGTFTFATRIVHNGSYDVTVAQQPAGQTCTVTNGSGTATANVSNVAVVCTTKTYTIGGTISGLSGTVVLRNNGGDPLTRTTNDAFTFATRIVHNGSYNVTVGQQPAGQTCTVTNGSGTATANVSNVAVVCTTKTYTIGGTLSGLTGTVVLQNNGGNNLTRSTNGAFVFSARISHGSSYSVTVLTQPVGQVCTVVNGSGWADADVTDIAVQCATPAAGDLDPTFGDAGVEIVELSAISDAINAIAIQSDGKIVAAGYVMRTDFDFAVTRFNEDGSIDRSFATNGSYVGGFWPGTDSAWAVALQADGKIVAVGPATTSSGMIGMGVVRLNTDGTLDTTFYGGGGVILIVFGYYDSASAVAIQPTDGKIIVGGYATNPITGNYDSVLVRLNVDGTLDTTFGQGGFAVRSASPTNDGIHGLAVQADGKIVASGFARRADSTQSALVARFTTTGAFDTTFNGVGYSLATPSTMTMNAGAVAVDGGGRPIICGATQTPSVQGFVGRRTAAGGADATFDGDGWLFLDPAAAADDGIFDLALQSDGSIVVAGYSGTTMLVARVTTNGTPDTRFGADGIGVYDLGQSAAVASTIAIQPDGKYVAAGYVSDGTRHRSALIRVLP